MTPPTPILDALAKHPDDDQPELLRCYRHNMDTVNPELYTEKQRTRIAKQRGLVLFQTDSPHREGPAFLLLWSDGNTTVCLRKHLIPATLDHTSP